MKKLLAAGAFGALAFLSIGGVAHAQDASESVVVMHDVSGAPVAQTVEPVVQALSVGAVPARIESGGSGLAASATGPNGAILVAVGGLALMVGTSGALALVRVRHDG